MSGLTAPSKAQRAPADRVTVRGAAPADAPTLEAIEAASFIYDRLSSRALARNLRSPTANIFVAAIGGVLAGYAMVFFRRGSTLARLYSIASVPNARGRGIGSRLMEACEHAAIKRGCDRLRLEVREKNRPAIAMYERLGYRRIGRYENYYQDGAPALRFEKQLVST
ncbi:MAG: GNAT family N-acetyltransferase [Hyphomonadaceae bacterium]